jgi:hypothetical protein
MADLAEKARVLQDSRAPGEAFFDLFAAIVQAGADNRGLSEAFAGSDCVDLEVLGRESGYDVSASLGQLLLAAQQSGEIRDDVDYPAVRALLAGCSTGVHGGADTTILLGVIRQGLVPVPLA